MPEIKKAEPMTKRVMIATAMTATLALSACMEPSYLNSGSGGYQTQPADPYARTKSGAVIGGVLGGVVGAAAADKDERAKGALIGAVIGGAAGAAVGNHLDRQAADLRADLQNQSIDINNTGDQLIVTMPQGILFATDSTDVRADLRRDLGALANNLNAYPNSTVQVIGHTDNVGEAAYNYDLSQRRAQSVASVLFQNGVSPSRVQAYGRGEDAPIASNLTPEGRAQNRRVEIIITPTN